MTGIGRSNLTQTINRESAQEGKTNGEGVNEHYDTGAGPPAGCWKTRVCDMG